MTIGGIYDSFQSSYYLQRIPSVDPEKLEKTGQQSGVSDNKEQRPVEELNQLASSPAQEFAQVNKASRVADLENVSLKFNKSESFDYIGSESSLDNLDMQKAISDMRKDQVLQGYQYFVGSSRNYADMAMPEDGIVIIKK